MRHFWVNDVIYSNSQPSLRTRKIDSGRKFSEIKLQKTWVLMFVRDWNLIRYLRKTYCVRKLKKNGYGGFVHRGTVKDLNQQWHSVLPCAAWLQTCFIAISATNLQTSNWRAWCKTGFLSEQSKYARLLHTFTLPTRLKITKISRAFLSIEGR